MNDPRPRPAPTSATPTEPQPLPSLDEESLASVIGGSTTTGGAFVDGGITADDDWETPIA
ncbi:MAG: hypothetical protein K0V04_04575 [Deltaproteobacteria bacterium]|nr:hypothetical protein [Deltaproteobacteria bacterium]